MHSPRRFRRAFRTAAVLGATGALLAGGLTACSSDSDDSAASSGPTVELTEKAATGEAIKIGVISSEGGPVSAPAPREAAEAAVRYLNDNAGGVNGHKIDLVVCKQHEEAASATACANEMVEKKVAAVISPFSSMGAVIGPIIVGAKIPYISQAPVSAIEYGLPGAYMLSGGGYAVLAGQAAHAAKNKYKKVTVIIGDTGDAAASIGKLGGAIFKQVGVEFKVVTVPTSTADVVPVITAGLADKPDAVSILGDAKQCSTAIKALQTVAPDIKKYLITSCLDSNVTDATGEDAIEGSVAFTTVNPMTDDPTVNLFRSVLAKYSPSTDIRGLAYLGYQPIMSIAEAGKALPAGPVTAEQIHAALKGAKDLPVPAAPGLTFTCDGKQVPQMPTLCGKSILVSDIGADLAFENTVVENK
ncbi:ABC transporter substrate-binding protein [Gordonia spumicola]|uniref:ABC transporter substrate-binding protein n=1 Tax=Gordonia spumicola TaxID=589161 RepID=A0A7I9V3P3_9ACTN|nr:ABC transporter substrate-binding protein [Gordonia spumicola]GED99783.1 ABC transporter substrate-binding protein [Gordonia spumicola]